MHNTAEQTQPAGRLACTASARSQWAHRSVSRPIGRCGAAAITPGALVVCWSLGLRHLLPAPVVEGLHGQRGV
eukprot:181118-Alexandrium_andersonii.AAC.1